MLFPLRFCYTCHQFPMMMVVLSCFTPPRFGWTEIVRRTFDEQNHPDRSRNLHFQPLRFDAQPRESVHILTNNSARHRVWVQQYFNKVGEIPIVQLKPATAVDGSNDVSPTHFQRHTSSTSAGQQANVAYNMYVLSTHQLAHVSTSTRQRILDRAQARGNDNNTAHAGNRNSLNGGGSEQVDKQDNCRQPQKTSFSMHTAFLEKSGPARIQVAIPRAPFGWPIREWHENLLNFQSSSLPLGFLLTSVFIVFHGGRKSKRRVCFFLSLPAFF